MTLRSLLKTALLATAVGLAATPALAQNQTQAQTQQARRNFTPPKTSWGEPDLQGVWSNVTITPMERPATFGDRKVLTPEEVQRMEGRAVENVEYENRPTDPNQGTEDQTRKNCQGAGGRDCGYNAGWKDSTVSVMRVNGEPRTSFITTTPNGRIPPRVAATAAQSAVDQREALAGSSENSTVVRAGQNDNPETRGLAERCIAFGNTIGPMSPNGYYNNNIRISQSKGYVAITLEMVHDTRIIKIGGQHRTDGVRTWFGESVGRWEGNTLVVTTKNYHPSTSYRGASQNLTLTERFTRVSPTAVLYQFELDDPTVWATKWGGEYEFYPTVGDMYEYACHEGNYGLEGILAGARHEDTQRAQSGSPSASR